MNMSIVTIACVILAYAAIINLIAFRSFRDDKRAALAKTPRVPESLLLMQAMLGGSVGAWIGQRLFRHKTKKQPFRAVFFAIVVIQLAALAFAAGFWFVYFSGAI